MQSKLTGFLPTEKTRDHLFRKDNYQVNKIQVLERPKVDAYDQIIGDRDINAANALLGYSDD